MLLRTQPAALPSAAGCGLLSRLVLFVGLTLPWVVNAQQQEAFTLQQCVDYALVNNQDLLNSKLDERIASARVNENRAIGLPQLQGNMELTANPIIQTIFFPGDFVGGGQGEILAVEAGTNYSGNANLEFSQMVFDKLYFTGLQAARTYRELTQKNTIKTEVDLVERVQKAYYSVLVNEERLALVQVSFNRLDTLLEETRSMYQEGFVEKIDVDRIAVQRNNLKTQLENTQRLYQLSLVLLKYQMSYPLDQELQLAEKLENIKAEFAGPMGEPVAPEKRIEFRQLENSRRLKEMERKVNEAGYFPRLFLTARLGALTGVNDFPNLFERNNWFGVAAVGLRLEVPIFDGLKKFYVNQQRRLELVQLDNQLNRLRESIDLEVRQSRTNLRNNLASLNNQEENMELAREVYRVARIKYEEGVGSNNEVLDANRDYEQAQSNYLVSLYDALISKIELDRALGNLKP